MKEAIFNSEIVASLKDQGFWAYKIPDMPHFAGAMFRFDREKPFDIVACKSGLMLAIEGKQLKSYQAFGSRHMRPHQIKSLDEVVSRGGKAFVFLNIRQKKPYLNRLLIFEWPNLTLSTEKASFKKVELQKMPFVEGKKGQFDLSVLEGPRHRPPQ